MSAPARRAEDPRSARAGGPRAARAEDRPLVALRTALVALVLVVGLVAVAAVRARVLDDARDRQVALTRRTGDLLVDQVRQLDATMSGSRAVVGPDGSVSATAIDAFGAGVVEISLLSALAYVEVVTEDQRTAFEARIGRPITDRVDGEPVDAPPRDEHFAVVRVFPSDGPGGQLIGYDLAGNPVRDAAALAARDSGELVVSPPTPSQPTGRLAAFVTQALYLPGAPVDTVAQRRAATVGFLSSAFIIEDLFTSVVSELPGGTRVAIRDGDELIASTADPPSGHTELTIPVQQRSWTIAVEDVRDPSWEVVWATAGLTLLVAGGLAFVLWRGARHEQALSRSYDGVRRTADLAQRLAASPTVAGVAEVVEDDVPPVFDAVAASVRLVDRAAGALDDADRSGELVLARAVPPGGRRATDNPEPEPGLGPDHDDATGAAARVPLRDRAGVVTAVLEIAWDRPDPFDPTTLATLTTVTELCEQALDRARAAEALARDAERSRRLAELGEVVTVARTVDDLARAITEHGARAIGATAAFLAILDDDRRGVRVHHDAPLGDQLGARYSHQSVDDAHVTTEAVRTRSAVLVGDLDDCRRRFPDVADDMVVAGWSAIAALPLLAFDGRVLGVLGAAWAEPVDFGGGVLPTITTAADLCAETLERTTITDAGARLAGALAALAVQLNASRTLDEVVDAITTHAASALDGDAASIAITRPGMLPLGVPTPEVRQALATRELVTVTGDGVLLEAALPLVGADGRDIGALALRWDHGVPFDGGLRDRLRTVASMCAQSIERAHRTDTEHGVIAMLQRRVLSPIPAVDGTRAAARYVPASGDLGLGGDWYDGIALDGGRLAVVLGDVTGHGIDAVAEMALRRSSISTLLRSGVGLDELLVRASVGFGPTDETSLATVAVAIVDPERDELSYVTAGHPPPLLRRPDGTVELLDDAAGSLLGLPVGAITPGRRPFPPGATVVLYSDGLVERRDEAIDEGIGRLAAALAVAPADDVEALAEALFAVPRHDVGDDVALTVVSRTVG
jgi:GAF domain-containing protein